jgi:outer membrane protein assembly factor BamE (lipoprotein component of BamABCDE complex)
MIGTAVAACSPIVDHRGYLPKGEDIQKVQAGMSKTEVEAILGSPSTTATINSAGDSYYYISSTVEQTAFFQPEVTDRQIFAVRFDRDDRVEKFAHYGLEDGVIIDFISRETPTRGKELGILEQLFQNLGRFDPG